MSGRGGRRAGMTLRRLVVSLVSGIALVAGIIGPAGPAGAAFPGPDGRIAFGSTRPGNQAIFSMKADGTDVRQLTHFRKNFQTANPNWSPDGSKIVFQAGPDFKDRDIWIMDGDGANAHRVFADPWFLDRTPNFAPDGQTIVFARSGDETTSIWTVSVSGKHLMQLTPGTEDVFDFYPAYSPNGSEIAFSSFGRGGRIAAVYVMKADGTHVHRITPARLAGSEPDWSPDGSQITFWSHCCDPNNPEIWVVNADGSGLRQLTDPDPSHDFSPVFSPAGDKISFERDAPDFSTSSIYVMNPDGTDAHDIQDDAYQPSWGPNP
jgi:Tol biopolymer transport system component